MTETSKTAEPTSGETEPKPAETVEVPKSFVENLQKQMKKMEEKQTMLEKIADKKQLARYYQQNQEKLPSEFLLRTIDGKVILGWRMVEDKGSYQNALTGAWTELQTVELVYETKKDDKFETQQMPHRDFIRRYVTVTATLVSKTQDEKSGNLILKVKRNDNDRVYNIDVRYVN